MAEGEKGCTEEKYKDKQTQLGRDLMQGQTMYSYSTIKVQGEKQRHTSYI